MYIAGSTCIWTECEFLLCQRYMYIHVIRVFERYRFFFAALDASLHGFQTVIRSSPGHTDA